ncbi:hypothetical protein FF011L_18440 [Roseimaritima multifibrata]|uniref:Uncharacterized protein n=1 Tax=Roseimaritima multifibrata TaxID=1930274 RepID=A0A517MDX8_9BACT|nr:hypothetical protein [Roseimaritima multifibrata]QDS93089.1 hypothetical protein FF011L_18440 [Roseimaritima multifibrata]
MVSQNLEFDLGPGKKDPSPEQIAARCEEIQKSWNRRTKLVRSGMTKAEADRTFHWRIPLIDLVELSLSEDNLSDPLSN